MFIKTSVKVTKAWNDKNDQDGKRPGSVTVTLYKNGVATKTTGTISSSNSWTYTFEDLDQRENGEDITYTVVEEEKDIPSEYELESTTGDMANGFIITNKHVPELINLAVDGTMKIIKMVRDLKVLLSNYSQMEKKQIRQLL